MQSYKTTSWKRESNLLLYRTYDRDFLLVGNVASQDTQTKQLGLINLLVWADRNIALLDASFLIQYFTQSLLFSTI
jgi:hypothetical protein